MISTHEGSSERSVADLTVFQHGLGKAGLSLHGSVWNQLGVQRVGFDPRSEHRQSAMAQGVHVIDDMSELEDFPVDIYDNTTATGHHAQSTEDFLRSVNSAPTAYILEKPVVTPDEHLQMEANLDQMDRRHVFVNENYLALRAVTRGQEIIGTLAQSGVVPTDIVVHFTKDRVPNVVLDKRFTDSKGLSVYGIEMPHQLAIASALLGEELQTENRSTVIENRFLHDIDGIEESEGNVTVLRQDGVNITMRQGLGPFDFAPDNSLKRREYDWKSNEADRYAEVRFNDGSLLRLTLDPVPNLPRYHSEVKFTASNPELSFVERFEDNSLKNLIGAVATFAASGRTNRPAILDNIGPDIAMRYAEQLSELRNDAGDPEKIGQLAPDNFNKRYYKSLRASK